MLIKIIIRRIRTIMMILITVTFYTEKTMTSTEN